jgi:hypothetical protein
MAGCKNAMMWITNGRKRIALEGIVHEGSFIFRTHAEA